MPVQASGASGASDTPLLCSSCQCKLPPSDFSKAQLKKKAERRCGQCVLLSGPCKRLVGVTAAPNAAALTPGRRKRRKSTTSPQ